MAAICSRQNCKVAIGRNYKIDKGHWVSLGRNRPPTRAAAAGVGGAYGRGLHAGAAPSQMRGARQSLRPARRRRAGSRGSFFTETSLPKCPVRPGFPGRGAMFFWAKDYGFLIILIIFFFFHT
jgi:hypothetical protein